MDGFLSGFYPVCWVIYGAPLRFGLRCHSANNTRLLCVITEACRQPVMGQSPGEPDTAEVSKPRRTNPRCSILGCTHYEHPVRPCRKTGAPLLWPECPFAQCPRRSGTVDSVHALKAYHRSGIEKNKRRKMVKGPAKRGMDRSGRQEPEEAGKRNNRCSDDSLRTGFN